MKTKICNYCGLEKFTTEFNLDKRYSDGFYYRCKKCISILYIFRKYGVNLDEELIKQNNKCLICDIVFTDVGDSRPYVDHNHETGEFRGILCYNCNLLIGLANENIDILQSAVDYLIKNDTDSKGSMLWEMSKYK